MTSNDKFNKGDFVKKIISYITLFNIKLFSYFEIKLFISTRSLHQRISRFAVLRWRPLSGAAATMGSCQGDSQVRSSLVHPKNPGPQLRKNGDGIWYKLFEFDKM